MKNMAESQEPPEKLAAMRNIRRLMAFWQIEPDELHGVPAAPPRPAPAPAAPRYRHPVTHEQWHGEGPQPDWLRTALLREGYTVEELRRCAAEAAAT
jgi:DNA-binding protein H-NS